MRVTRTALSSMRKYKFGDPSGFTDSVRRDIRIGDIVYYLNDSGGYGLYLAQVTRKCKSTVAARFIDRTFPAKGSVMERYPGLSAFDLYSILTYESFANKKFIDKTLYDDPENLANMGESMVKKLYGAYTAHVLQYSAYCTEHFYNPDRCFIITNELLMHYATIGTEDDSTVDGSAHLFAGTSTMDNVLRSLEEIHHVI